MTSAVFVPTAINDMWTAWGPCINYWSDELYNADWLKAPHTMWNSGKGWKPYLERWDSRTHNKMGMLRKGSIRRMGINLGAPADRMSPDGGTLWLNYPNASGPSPEVEVTMQPAKVNWIRRHSFRIDSGKGRRFVSATGAEGLDEVKVRLYSDRKRTFTVRLYFAEYDKTVKANQRRFSVSIQGGKVGDIDIIGETGAANVGMVKEYKGIKATDYLTVGLKSLTSRKTLLCGIEIATSDVALGTIPRILSLRDDSWLGGD